jgi:hypothetical protein
MNDPPTSPWYSHTSTRGKSFQAEDIVVDLHYLD